jgi:DNA-directed RNA polymerase specialized sigma24 family protein
MQHHLYPDHWKQRLQTCLERAAGQVFIALGDLPEHYHCVLLLRTAGSSYTEIAALQGKTPHAMTSFLLRGRESFQQHDQTPEQQEEVSA